MNWSTTHWCFFCLASGASLTYTNWKSHYKAHCNAIAVRRLKSPVHSNLLLHQKFSEKKNVMCCPWNWNPKLKMGISVQMSRLLRKKPLDVQQRSSSVSTSLSSTLFTLTYKTANAPLVIGYFVAFSYSALLAPSILPGVIFLASITSLFSGSTYSNLNFHD